MNRTVFPWLLVSLMLITASCNAPQELPAATDSLEPPVIATDGLPLADRATPVAESPAAGICGQTDSSIVTMTINPDMPDPRCLEVRGDQHLRVVNQRGEILEISLGPAGASLPPGSEYTFDRSFAELLLPGVHPLIVSPCCGGEIWFRPSG